MKLLYLLAFLCISHNSIAQEIKSSYQDGDQKLNGLFYSSGKSKKGVLILPAWKGIDDEAKTAALNLQKEGYNVFIADIYGEGNYPKDNTGAAKIAGYYKENYQAYQQRIQLALQQLRKSGVNISEIVVIGYCFGGTGALEAARANLEIKGVVSIHGGLTKSRTDGLIHPKVLILHGAEDKSATEAQVEALRQELTTAKADWQLIYFAGCGHTWTDPKSTEYNALMAQRAWDQVLLFLKEVL